MLGCFCNSNFSKVKKFDVAEYSYDLPSSPTLLPQEKGARTLLFPLLRERALGEGKSEIHAFIQQRRKYLPLIFENKLLKLEKGQQRF